MARDLQESVDNLSREMRNWSRLFTDAFDTPTKRYNAILNSLASGQSAIRRQRIIDLDSRLASMAKMRRRSQDLFEGMDAMRTNPNAFDRPGQPIALYNAINKYEKKLSDYTHLYGSHGASNVLDHELNRKILSIRNPFEAKRLDLIDEYGHDGADRILQAEADVDFNSKLEAARTKSIIEAHKKRQAGFDRGHNAEVRARLGRMHDAKAFRYAMMDTDERNIRTLMDSHRSWNRGQAEQVYFQQLTENTKWLRLIGKNNPKIAKSLIPIAKAVGKASGLPIIGAFARNPALGAITALIGGGLSAGSYSLGRSGTLAKWMNARAVTGDIGPGTFHGLAATGMSYEQMLQSLSKYSVKSSEARFGGGFDKYAELAKYGVDVSGLFNPYLTAEERRAEEYRVISSANQADRAAIMSTLGMSPEEYRSERLKNTARSEWSFSDLQLDIYRGVTKKMKENHPIIDFLIPDKFYQFHSLLAANKELEDRKFFGDKAVDSRNEIYNLHRWDEIRETAEIDDRYRAGMYDNSVTNNDASRSVSLQVNVASPQITTTGDPVDFAKGISIIGSRALSEYQSIIENTDTKRKQ